MDIYCQLAVDAFLSAQLGPTTTAIACKLTTSFACIASFTMPCFLVALIAESAVPHLAAINPSVAAERPYVRV